VERQDIDDKNHLYRWIHPNHIKDNRITSAAFKHRDKEKTRRLSIDVAEWTTAEECLSFSNNPDTRLGVLVAGQVRKIDTQCIVHEPLTHRYAHALVIGEKPPSVCKLFARNCLLLPS